MKNLESGIGNRESGIVSIQLSAVSRQRSADVTQIKPMLTCFIQKLKADN
ncbi:hypothetical protein BJP36_40945 [Moorena producens JHB]|uniref:Uncharacterized protein n=1 Tax=Moorena producens (strain JHB) TaxID=1454205 RepID=A0A9Q9UVE0_MOOP1|nr:hypothetical protein [Moorena producens]WAN68736.1 hypothetical protein BJP36_40945 [Moorena producens JHB]